MSIRELYRMLEEEQLMRGANIENLQWKDEVVACVLPRDGGRHTVEAGWLPAWHGTNKMNLASIFEHGLVAPGTQSRSTKVHTSPSVLYAAGTKDACFAETLQCGGQQWLVFVLAHCKPGSMTKHPCTVEDRYPVAGEPEEEEVEWQSSGRDGENLTVTAAVFIKKEFLDSIGSHGAGCPS
eukprot:Hpha_TRINITY_DN16795_c1_g6::TRINITY_DN16795_c1_g6_i1::g.78231::m.78231